MKSKINKQNIFLIVLLVILIFIILEISYAFLQTSFFASNDNVLKVGSLALVLDESDGNAITVSADGPLADSEGVTLDNYYSFKLTNNGKVASSYTIYLDDQPLDDGDERIDQKYVHYSLERDSSNNVAKSLTGNQKLESGLINSGQTINYKLRLWFSSDMTAEEENKVFKAKLRIEGVSTSAESLNKKCQDAGGDYYVDGECRKYYVMINQLIQYPDFSKIIGGWNAYNLVVEKNNLHYNPDNEYIHSNANVYNIHIDNSTHVFYEFATSSIDYVQFHFQTLDWINDSTNDLSIGSNFSFDPKSYTNKYSIYYIPIKLSKYFEEANGFNPYFSDNSLLSVGVSFYIEPENYLKLSYQNINLIDLTLMFGEGNEPNKEWCDKNLTDYIEYNESGVRTPISDINYTGKTSYYDVIGIS